MHTLLILHTQYKKEWENVLYWRKAVKTWIAFSKQPTNNSKEIIRQAYALTHANDCLIRNRRHLMEKMP